MSLVPNRRRALWTPTQEQLNGTYAPLAQPTFTAPNEAATLGANLVTDGDFASGTLGNWGNPAGWSIVSGAAQHSTGNIDALAQGITVTSGGRYQVDWSQTGATAGTLQIFIGSATDGAVDFWIRTSALIVAAASGTQLFRIVPSSNYNGTLDNILVRQITADAAAVSTWGATAQQAVRAPNTTSVGVGRDALRSNTTGADNSALGRDALRSNTTGVSNSALGRDALRSNTTGADNSALGVSAGHAPNGVTANATTTGARQTLIGMETGQASPTQRNDVVALGYRALIDAENTTALGVQARALHAGSVALGQGAVTTAADQVMVGTRDIEIAGNATRGLVLRSPNGTRHRITVSDTGTLSATPL